MKPSILLVMLLPLLVFVEHPLRVMRAFDSLKEEHIRKLFGVKNLEVEFSGSKTQIIDRFSVEVKSISPGTIIRTKTSTAGGKAKDRATESCMTQPEPESRTLLSKPTFP